MSEGRYAVLIASSRFPEEPKLQELRCPENDVDGLNEILSSKERGEFTETVVLKNRPHHEVLLKINQVLKRAGNDDLVLIYYSGHGKLDLAGRLHLATVDTTVDALEATSIPVESIRNYVDVSPSNKVALILDCCYSGAVGGAFARSSLEDQLQRASGGRGTYLISASTSIQVALEKEGDRYGVFTKHLIGGIQEGVADLDGDGRITMDELYRYVHNRVLGEGAQEPTKWDLNVRGELVIARSGRTPHEDRRRQIRELLLTLANQGVLPDAVLTKAMEVIAFKPAQLSEVLRPYDRLLDALVQKRLGTGEFIHEWYLVSVGLSREAATSAHSPTPLPMIPISQTPVPALLGINWQATTTLQVLTVLQIAVAVGLAASIGHSEFFGESGFGLLSLGAIIGGASGVILAETARRLRIREAVWCGWAANPLVFLLALLALDSVTWAMRSGLAEPIFIPARAMSGGLAEPIFILNAVAATGLGLWTFWAVRQRALSRGGIPASLPASQQRPQPADRRWLAIRIAGFAFRRPVQVVGALTGLQIAGLWIAWYLVSRLRDDPGPDFLLLVILASINGIVVGELCRRLHIWAGVWFGWLANPAIFSLLYYGVGNVIHPGGTYDRFAWWFFDVGGLRRSAFLYMMLVTVLGLWTLWSVKNRTLLQTRITKPS